MKTGQRQSRSPVWDKARFLARIQGKQILIGPITTPPVVFDFDVWMARYPEFSGVSQAQALGYFAEAGLYCSNSTDNPAFCVGILPTLLNMLTAHIAYLYAPKGPNGQSAQVGQPASPIVGHINQATEGSVNVSADVGDVNSGSPSQWWYMQSQYGASYWAATARYRTFQYAANPTIVPSAIYTGRRLGYGGGWN
jgi:Protein of unknown function (DUF4054)